MPILIYSKQFYAGPYTASLQKETAEHNHLLADTKDLPGAYETRK